MALDLEKPAFLAGKRILIVEDEYLIAVEMAEHLVVQGAEIVGPAPDAQSALRIIQDGERLDGAVLDILLRGDRVYAVADALRERRVPFVFVTGLDHDGVPTAYASDPFLSKPVDAQIIAEKLLG